MKEHINKKNMLKIQNLHVATDKIEILKGINLTVKCGETHVIMGKNGSGKSTLAKAIAGHPKYTVTKGQILFNNQDITFEEPEKRSHKGIFLAFQYPVEISGVSNTDFLRLAYNSNRKANNFKELDPLSFFELINAKIKKIQIEPSFLVRNVNEGFSGGEKKKNEILQMALLRSKMCVLDEIDSGLDIDALKTISDYVNKLRTHSQAIIIITHYQRLLDYITPDFIHVMKDGLIVYTGGPETAKALEKHGYEYIKQ
uniref:Probable ATP-dependent transporter ycf16 n=1 Tax=Melanthalia intermedia TaxID=172989 RepID=A0A345UAQ1_9FLOR|nr:Iron-sulfur cluster formation ABC transporter ATP-binding subunit [Melanthalia intermedia]AXI97537.1 Iron-sulfur cluster formation ABC transporter ATP-binding subunit [Melanthalia intermedia]